MAIISLIIGVVGYMLSLLFAVVLVLGCSALCSGAEAALFSVPVLKAKQLAQSNSASAKSLLHIRENMKRPIATVVILNNIANIVGSITVGGLAAQVLGNRWVGVFSGVLTFLVIVFAEIVPKTIGELHAERIALLVARPILALTWLLTPVNWLIEHITAPLTKGGDHLTTDEAEIKLLAQMGRKQGIIEEDEADMIHRVFSLNDVSAAELMTPRVMMTFLKHDDTLEESKKAILASHHSRIVVIRETPDDVSGIVFKDELLTAMVHGNMDLRIAELQHPARFVPKTILADQLLPVFQKTRQHIAIVIGEFGGVLGVVTLEDVLELLTGDIVDETDQTSNLQALARLKSKTLLADNKAENTPEQT